MNLFIGSYKLEYNFKLWGKLWIVGKVMVNIIGFCDYLSRSSVQEIDLHF